MKLTNQKIYNLANLLLDFKTLNLRLPVRINFFLQKNINLITEAAAEIERAKVELGAQYGSALPEGGYFIPEEYRETVQRELSDLFNLEQDLNIHQFLLSDFDGLELTFKQMEAIMFMIIEE